MQKYANPPLLRLLKVIEPLIVDGYEVAQWIAAREQS